VYVVKTRRIKPSVFYFGSVWRYETVCSFICCLELNVLITASKMKTDVGSAQRQAPVGCVLVSEG
jgi:hypothetical protein